MSTIQVKGLPWAHGLGTDVKDCTSAQEVMEKAGLNWNVEKCELSAKMPLTMRDSQMLFDNADEDEFAYCGKVFRTVPNQYGTYRTDINQPLGIVKQKYEVVQNMDAFNFFDDAIGEGKARWEYAGMMGYGQKIYVAAKLPTEITVKGDPVETYLVFSNSHDGSSALDILFTPVRMFCLNCLNAALRNADSHIRLRHTKSVGEKLQQGKEVLKIACEYADDTKLLYESLAMATLSEKQVMEYFARIVLTDEEVSRVIHFGGVNAFEKAIAGNWYIKDRAELSTKKINKLAAIWNYYLDGPGQNQILGNAWGAYNAITGYYSNVANVNGEKRLDGLLWGSVNNTMNKALNNITEIAKIA